ncbi:MAG: hypothetical protein GY827_04645 [Cytophagales bacterium]|nr:hypothetical protein [Cytophagales bacterium]
MSSFKNITVSIFVSPDIDWELLKRIDETSCDWLKFIEDEIIYTLRQSDGSSNSVEIHVSVELYQKLKLMLYGR